MNNFISTLFSSLSFFLLLNFTTIKSYAQTGNSPVIITEFLSSNSNVLLDKDGDSSDWIELFNKSNNPVSIENWYLTDNADNLLKWQFPNITLFPGEYLIVFASGKDLKNSNSELHTNFKLSSNGEYLALIESDGQTIATQFNPSFEAQQQNISYGYPQNVTVTNLLDKDDSGKLLIPINNNLNQTWTGLPANEPFTDSNWQNVTTCIGFDKTEVNASNDNIAPLATASQSSEWGGFPASFANDGIYTNITHTASNDLSPWLDLDFDTDHIIGKIVLYNRTNCCQDRLYNITVEIMDSNGAIVYTSETLNPYNEGETPISPGNSITLDILSTVPSGVTGNKIRIKKTSVSAVGEYLSLAEVEVFDIKEHYISSISSNIETEMSGINTSAYMRFPFNVTDVSAFNALLLKMNYDDGFVAYLNGTQVASVNAPTGTLRYNSVASDTHSGINTEVFSLPISALKQGQNILAIQGLNLSVNDLNFFIKPQLEALNITTNTTKLVYFENPTPNSYNNEGIDGLVNNSTYNFTRGFYGNPFQLTISGSTPGASLIYTTDGSTPSSTNGVLITAPTLTSTTSTTISIDKTTVVRSISSKENYKSSKVQTHSYIFVDDVISSNVMDTNITENATYGPQMKDALLDLPTISIAIKENITKTEIKFTSMEWILPNGDAGFQENAGVKLFGGEFTNFAKKNFRLYFKKEFGASKLNFPLFESHENGIEPVTVFDQLELRAGSHDMVMRGFYMSNRFTDDTMLDMGNLNPHGRFVHLYIDGVYWGMYHLRERWNADMQAQYLGGEKEDYEAINGNWNVGGWAVPGKPYDGDGSAWEKIKSLREDYQAIRPLLDVPHYIDYMLMFMHGNSEDEYRCAGPTQAGSGFKFFLNDADGFLRDAGNRTIMDQPGKKNGDGPGSIFSMLFKEANPEYKTLLADRIHKHFFRDGAMTPEKIEERLLKRCNQVELAFLAESARWGYRTPDSWENAKNEYLNNVVPFRTNTVIEQYRNAGFYPSIEAPYLNINNTEHYGGEIEQGDLLSLNATMGDIYYTLDGTDPYIPGNNTTDLITLFEEDAVKTVFVPTSSLPNNWNSDINFDDSAWINGTGSFGYERGNEIGKEIGIVVENDMYNKQTGCLARIKFNIDNLNDIKRLFLHLSYDDGAIVYLNGQEVIRINAPGGTPLFNATALSTTEASPLASFNITEYVDLLKTGSNIIAIHGMNISLTSSDFYISAKLVGDKGFTIENLLSSSAIKYEDESLELNETTTVKARATQNGDWSALSDAIYLIDSIEEENENSEYNNIIAFPNPFNNNITLNLKTKTDTNAILIIYDALGRGVLLKEFALKADTLTSTLVQANSWNNGLYIYKLTLSTGEQFSGKIIREKRF